MSSVDYRSALAEQIQSLKASCAAYGSGKGNEAARIAQQLLAIFHDTAKSASLLSQLKSKSINMLSTAVKNPTNGPSTYWSGLIQWELDVPNSVFVARPKLDATKKTHRFVSLDYWWNSEPIYHFGHKRIRRRDLVLGIAGAEGGMPVGESLPPDYQRVIDGTAWKMTMRPEAGPEREIIVYHAHLAALRQIGHEALNSPELIKLA